MRERFHIYHQTVLLLMMAAVLLTACSSESPEAQAIPAGEVPVDHVVHLMPFTTSYLESGDTHRAAPTGYSDYLLDKVTEMGVYVFLPPENYETPAVPEIQRIRYDGAKWHAYFNVIKDKDYAVYGYLPKLTGMNSSLVKSSADKAELTITGMKPITTDDICIITGVKETEAGLKEGNFSWKQDIEGDDYFIYMLLNHLYASVNFSLQVSEEYAQLRTIKLKTMTLSVTKASVNAVVELTHNTVGNVPITDVTYTSTEGSCSVDIFNSTDGEALSSSMPLNIPACFAPTLSGNLTLYSTYDVYDSKGNLIREDCEATNIIPNLNALRGQRVQLNLTVDPTYLYVMSDKDLDNLFVIQ